MSSLIDLLPSKLQNSSPFDTSTVIAITVFSSLQCASIIIGHFLGRYPWANESITALLLGLISGGFVLWFSGGESSQILKFSEELFFIYLLPPIIFNAGFQIKHKYFFKNFTTILLFGVLGTIISFCIISLGAFLLFKRLGVTELDVKDYLAVGAILSATDSVCTLQVLDREQTPLLYSIVFGEGVVNDATSIVLFNAIQSLDFSEVNGMTALSLMGTFLYLFSTSTILGVAVGLLSAFVIKTVLSSRHSADPEIAIMMLMAYLSYMIAELINLSGILTVFFCGVVMSHYTYHNISGKSQTTTMNAFSSISFIAETFIFLYVGMDALDIDKWKESEASAGTSLAVSATLLAFVLIGRAAFVFLLASFANWTTRRQGEKIPFRKQFIIWWAGLMRGAVTVALSYNQFSDSDDSTSAENSLMITSTIIVVLFSTVVFGSITKPLIQALKGPTASTSDEDPSVYMNPDQIRARLIQLEPSPVNSVDDNDNHNDKRKRKDVHYYWRRFDNKFMRPVFGGLHQHSTSQLDIPDQNDQ